MDSYSISHCFNGLTYLHYQCPPPQAQIWQLELTTPTDNFVLLVNVAQHDSVIMAIGTSWN